MSGFRNTPTYDQWGNSSSPPGYGYPTLSDRVTALETNYGHHIHRTEAGETAHKALLAIVMEIKAERDTAWNLISILTHPVVRTVSKYALAATVSLLALSNPSLSGRFGQVLQAIGSSLVGGGG